MRDITKLFFLVTFYASLAQPILALDSTPLPRVFGGDPKHQRARDFLKNAKITNGKDLKEALIKIENNNSQQFMDIATSYRHSNHRWILDFAENIYQSIIANPNIYAQTKSFAAIGLSKLYMRRQLFRKYLYYAEEAIKFDPQNAFAWHRLGDVLFDIAEKRKAYLTALQRYNDTNNKKLKSLAYFGLGNTYEREGKIATAIIYYKLSLAEIPAYDIARRRLEKHANRR
jgi:tetratricopeptide (TPR) repeat protein